MNSDDIVKHHGCRVVLLPRNKLSVMLVTFLYIAMSMKLFCFALIIVVVVFVVVVVVVVVVGVKYWEGCDYDDGCPQESASKSRRVQQTDLS
jgi:hypothetical protein